MTRIMQPIVVAAVVVAFLFPASATAQRRARADCGSCTERAAVLGFLFRSSWDRDNDNRWRETITVEEVLNDTPAADQLSRGDVILQVNGLVATSQLFWSLRRTLTAGDTVRLRIRRGDADRVVTLSATERT